MTLEETIEELKKAVWNEGYWLNRPFAKWQAEAFLAFMQELAERRKAEENQKKEAVNHPAHYQGKRECIEVMRALFGDNAVMGFCKCNSFKYRFRQDGKGGAEDVQKAEWYEDYLIQMQEEKRKK